MIRDYLPIPLIPAAWALTFATLVYPGIDTYWIQHMNIFITGFLALFGALSWKAMDGEVLQTWRNIIALGFVFTGLGTLGFFVESYNTLLFGSSILYWFLAPAAGFKITSELMEEGSELYLNLAWLSLPAAACFIAAYAVQSPELTAISLVSIAAIQTASIVDASRRDHDW